LSNVASAASRSRENSNVVWPELADSFRSSVATVIVWLVICRMADGPPAYFIDHDQRDREP
jgi:hypothetical protein